MENSSEIAEDLGYVEIPEGLLIHPGEMKNYPPEKVCLAQQHHGRALGAGELGEKFRLADEGLA